MDFREKRAWIVRMITACPNDAEGICAVSGVFFHSGLFFLPQIVHLAQKQTDNTCIVFYDASKPWQKVGSKLQKFITNVCARDLQICSSVLKMST